MGIENASGYRSTATDLLGLERDEHAKFTIA